MLLKVALITMALTTVLPLGRSRAPEQHLGQISGLGNSQRCCCHSFNKYVLASSSVPSTMLGAEAYGDGQDRRKLVLPNLRDNGKEQTTREAS